MITDYMNEQSDAFRGEGLQPTYDVWGTVLEPNKDTEAGNIRVKVFNLKEHMDTYDSVPVLTPYGGGSYGGYMIPEEGDTVRLSFIGGDFRNPVVTGCLYPHDSSYRKNIADKKNAQKGCKLKNGSEIIFSGEEKKQKIEVLGAEHMCFSIAEENRQAYVGDVDGKNYLKVDKENGKLGLEAQKEVKIACGKSTLTLKENGTIELKCSNLILEADSIKVKGHNKIEMKGQQLALEGEMDMTLKARTGLKIQCSTQLKLSGMPINLN